MGGDHELAHRNERPAHRVTARGFWMDQTHVTNSQFAEFVDATGDVTTAERKPDWEARKVQLPPGTPKPPDSAADFRYSCITAQPLQKKTQH